MLVTVLLESITTIYKISLLTLLQTIYVATVYSSHSFYVCVNFNTYSICAPVGAECIHSVSLYPRGNDHVTNYILTNEE